MPTRMPMPASAPAHRRVEALAASLFVVGAVAQYAGAAIAVDLFTVVPAQSVAWLRVGSAALVLTVVVRPWRRSWTRPAVVAAGAFGVVTALMNTSFYLAAAHLPLGTTVAIEFAGPVIVAAIAARSARSIAALVLTVSGVALLSGISLAGEALGVLFALAAAATWAAYILLGARVSTATAGIDGLAVGLLIGAVVVAPIGVWGSGPALRVPSRLLATVVVGVLSTIVPYGLDQVVLRRVDAATFASLLALLPTTATIIGATVLHQTLAPWELVGIALVVVGLATRNAGASVGS